MSRSSTIPALAALSVCACILPSCDRSGDPGLKERVALLQAEVARRDASIKDLRDDFQKEKAATSASPETASAAPIDPAKARQSYLASVETLRGDLAKALGSDGTVERASVFPVSGPDPDYPISSKVAFTVSTKGNQRAEIVVPLFANASGEWKEASAESIAADFRKNLAAAPAPETPVASQPSAPPQQPATRPAPTQGKPLPNDVMGAHKTVQVGWEDSATPPAPGPAPAPAPSGRPAQPQAQQPAPTPQPPARQPDKPASPTKVMPSSRDVIIDFGH